MIQIFGNRRFFDTLSNTITRFSFFMNSMNDLIQSHDMYDPSHVQRPVSYQESHSQTPHQHPLPSVQAYEEPQYIEPHTPPPQQQYTSPHYPAAIQQRQYSQRPSYDAAQDRHTIHSMMREIAMMQRRLDIMMSSCHAMIERTHIMHEYHHIARYRSERHMQHPMQQQTPPPVPQQYTYQSPSVAQSENQLHTAPSTPPQPHPSNEEPLSIKEGVFDGANMISADGDMYAIPKEFLCQESLIEGDIMQAMIFASGQIQYKVSEPTDRENIMGILSTHSANSPHYIVQTANKAYKVLKEAVDSTGATPGNQVLLTVPVGGESEWAAIERVFNS